MKKIFAISIILCLAFSAFAAGTVKVGGAFNFEYGKTVEIEDILFQETLYKAHGFGFDVAGSYDINEKLSVWADFNMEFPADALRKSENQEDWSSIKDEMSNAKLNAFSIAAGAAYKIALDAPVNIKVGGGLFIERFALSGNPDVAPAMEIKETIFNVGITLYTDASYAINENFAVGITAMPRLGLFDSFTVDENGTDYNGKGFALSFSIPVVIGASYSF